MFNGFSNEITARVFDMIVSDPSLYDRAVAKVTSEPASAPNEIRTWVSDKLRITLIGDEAVRDLVNASQRAVRWEEIRAALKRQAA